MESKSNSSFDALCKEGSFRNESTLSDEEVIEKYFYSTADRHIITVFFPILLTFGLLGNLAFLAVVAKIPSMRTLTNSYLANLAICDTVFIITMTYDILGSYIQHAPLYMTSHKSDLGCIMTNSIIYVTLFTSVCLLLIMTTERYLGICRPLQHHLVVSKERTVKLIIMCWVFGILYSGLVVPRWGKVVKVCVLWPNSDRFADMTSKLSLSCTTLHPIFPAFSDIVQAIPFVVTLIFNTTMFSRIIKKLHKSIFGSTMKSRNQVARLLIATNVVFFLCLTPYFFIRVNAAVLYLSDYRVGIKIADTRRRTLLWFVRGLIVANATTNPLIYSVTNPRYRQAFLQLFSRSYASTGQRRSSSRSTQQTSNM
ncbi:kappa-type opioid receptor-like [Amphiura filiformis]|uniref:kappa-type opioid receptor-like n=1 Tax=Amphiura filiformis TaxID=82378 RepID=UPI003B21A434